jgi:transcriptional regulator with XRE-family HTH domain
MTKEKKEYSSTYERLIHEDSNFEKDLDKKYQEFVLSELLLAAMEEDHISIRKLAQEAGVSPSLVQDLRSGKRDNLTVKNFSSIVDALGYDIVLEKREKVKKREISKRMILKSPIRRTKHKRTKCDA